MIFHVHTYGCQMNERDSEAVAALLSAAGHEETDDEDAADMVIVNTCSVRAKAEEKALGKLGLLVAGARKGGRGKLVGVMGCMVQRMKEELLVRVPGLDFAIAPGRISDIACIVANAKAGQGAMLALDGEQCRTAVVEHLPHRVSAYVNILFGCERRCAYCIVPAVRGAEWSRPIAEVMEEIRKLAAGGVKEVTLLGQSVMSYGRKNDVCNRNFKSTRGYGEPLPRLLEAVNDAGIRRVRFTSGHPSGCTDELARAMSELPSVCEHLHLPLQSGCGRMLRIMNRGYTADEYRRAVHRLRRSMGDFAVTTDVIVGFPSETESEFEETRRFMDEIGFDNAFIFKYSPRPGTPAAGLRDDVPYAEKMRRNKALLADQDERGRKINGALAGKQVEVLVEGPSLRNASRWAGRTRTNKIVVFDPPQWVSCGDIVPVVVERGMAQTLYGSVAAENGTCRRRTGNEVPAMRSAL